MPQISVVLGPAAGGAAYGPALTDVIVMGPAGRVFVTGPDVIRRVTGEEVTAERLGGPDTHTRRSGVAHLEAVTDDEALYTARRLVSLLGKQGIVDAHAPDGPDPGPLVPWEHREAYDIRPAIRAVLDPCTVLELQPQCPQRRDGARPARWSYGRGGRQ